MTSRHYFNFHGLFFSSIQSWAKFRYYALLVLCCLTVFLLPGCFTKENLDHTSGAQTTDSQAQQCSQDNPPNDSNTVTAEVVALEQIITFNRFGAFNPAGMVYVLRKDVVDNRCSLADEDNDSKNCHLDKLDDDDIQRLAGNVRLRKDKRPRPLVLRVNECSYLKVKFWNLLSPLPTVHTRFQRPDFPEGGVQRHSVQTVTPPGTSLTDLSTPPRNPNLPNGFPFPRQEEPDYPTTRAASIHVNGLDYVPAKPEICDHLDDIKDADKKKITEKACNDPANNMMGSDGANVGNNPTSLVEPGQSTTYTWYGRQEGGYFMYSAGALAGGEGDGGQLGLGLFGSINVEPVNSMWYRSQVTYNDLKCRDDKICQAEPEKTHPYGSLDYKSLAIMNDDHEIVHSDLNAIIYQPNTKSGKNGELMESGMKCSNQSPGSSCGMSFREFTTIFHDENKVFQAFSELADESNPVSAVADGMAINYGSSGVGSAVLASKKHIGPAKDCPDCKLEEFFLSSWANGDPAMIVRRNIDGKEMEALYPDDPSNVHHSYLGDPVRFRNIHAGPKETHVFHLHAHQWLQDKNDPNANYLDSQTISPGSSYTYDIQYGGGGNRNLTVGDAIFHCHLYPHFAAGMWELWRNHDVFEDGKPGLYDKDNSPDPRLRNLPDGEITGGTPNPAIVPIPGFPLAPLPNAEFRGYPFFIAGKPGHRPPQPPLDMARDKDGRELNGGLPRHIITAGELFSKDDLEMSPDVLMDEVGGTTDTIDNKASKYIAKRTWKLNSDPSNLVMAAKLKSAQIKLLPQCGTKEEILAMAYHAGWDKETIVGLTQTKPIVPPDMLDEEGKPKEIWKKCSLEFKTVLGKLDNFEWQFKPENTVWPPKEPNNSRLTLWEGKGYKSVKAPYPNDSKTSKGIDAGNHFNPGDHFRVNGYAPAQGAPFADPCPSRYDDGSTAAVEVNRNKPRLYKSAYIQFDMTVNKYGWHDPQARMPVLEEDAAATLDGTRLPEPLFFRANSGDCIQFQATNLIPSVLNLDDFQIYTPTDTLGQHIHLVKFDVTSSDGSANGWNYEDGTFSPDEVRERVEASGRTGGSVVKAYKDQETPTLKPYRLPKANAGKDELGKCSKNAEENNKKHPWCGAQTTVQRWWADPVLNDQWKDRTMRAVFTHDHYGPSSHQQHGFYAALIVEPKDTVWTQLGGNPESVAETKNGVTTLKCAQPNAPGKAVTAIGKDAYGGGNQGKPLKCRNDGGPTSYAANIGFIDKASNETRKDKVRREYNLAFADFAILYNADLRPVNPPSRQVDLMLPHFVRDGLKPKPEGISTEDPGTRLLNYRNEPVPLRVAEEDHDGLEYHQKSDTANGKVTPAGDMANVFSSITHTKSVRELQAGNERIKKLMANVPHEIIDKYLLTSLLNDQKKKTDDFKKLIGNNEPWRTDGDPSTPILAAYEGDPLQLHLIQGAQEEQHVFSMTGLKWLAEPKSLNSGYMNGQQIGISEHFEFEISPHVTNAPTDYWYGSPAVENMWDGMWGLMRTFATKLERQANGTKKPIPDRHPEWLAELESSKRVFGSSTTCPSKEEFAPRKEFFVSAWRVADLLEGVSGSNKFYNNRFNINDPNGVVLVEVPKDVANLWMDGGKILDYLRKQYQEQGRPLEPLVLRANAGDCIKVNFKNYLPAEMADGAEFPQSWSYNLMPPIVNGFNFNQVQMSSAMGLVPQMVAADDVAVDSHNNIGKNLQADSIFKTFPHGCQSKSNNRFVDCNPLKGQVNTKQGRHFQSQAKYEWYLGDRKSLSSVEIQQELAQQGLKKCEAANKTNEYCDSVFANRTPSGDEITAIIRYRPIEFGATAIRNFGDVIKDSSHGAVGALIVEPRDAECRIGNESRRSCGPIEASDPILSRASADVFVPNKDNFRDFVLILQDDLSLQQNGQAMPNHRMADDAEDTGQKGFNYRTEPLWARNGIGTSGADFNELNQTLYTDSLSSYKNISPCPKNACSPETPVFAADKGQKVRFRIVHPGGHSRQHAVVLYGHNWEYQPWGFKSATMQDDDTPAHLKDPDRHVSTRIGAFGGLGPSRHVNILTTAGGYFCVPGDYLYRVQENFQFNGGMWGIFQVKDTQNTPKNCHHIE